jgi:type II secretory ATPase GspE/PulE/Tfp pilus assembly ATPase PilB-like protein
MPIITTKKTDQKFIPDPTATLNAINQEIEEKRIEKQAQTKHLDFVAIRGQPISAGLIEKINLAEAKQALALPFSLSGKKIKIAVAEPQNLATQNFIQQLAQKFEIKIYLASREGILDRLKTLNQQKPHKIGAFENQTGERDLCTRITEAKNLANLAQELTELSAEEILNRIFVGAVRLSASDIHLQPAEQNFLLRFRIDGVLQKILEFERKIGTELLNQLKYEAKLRLNVIDTPQDGRLTFQISKRKVDVRVATLPTEFGESVVCRLLDHGRKIKNLQELGFENSTLENFERALKMREGLILLTGPTGSGKTTTLYTLLNQLNSPEKKLATLEDPIEYHLKQVVQSQIDEEHGFSFAKGLRALLRQDPDVLMVGEIRDAETAETAAAAAMTGHLVLATLHTNSAVDAILRLRDLGVKNFVIAASLLLTEAQRLVRRPCFTCAEKISPDAKQIALFQKFKIKSPDFLWEIKGCKECGQTGYRGQLVIAENFLIEKKMRELILAQASAAEFTEAAKKSGMVTTAVDGLRKVTKKLTTLEEVVRATGINTMTEPHF